MDLKFTEKQFIDIVCYSTDRIAQHIHDLCLMIALHVREEGKTISKGNVVMALKAWAESSLLADYTVIESLMNSRETRVGRRNQSLFALGCVDQEDFRISDVESMVRSEFPNSTRDVNLAIGAMLSELSEAETPILKRTPGDAYQFCNPKYRICIRIMLEKRGDETVGRRDFASGVVPWRRISPSFEK